MDRKERIIDDTTGKYAWLLMFCFLCGSLLTLVYMPEKGGTSGLSMEAGAVFAAGALILSAALAVSVCGKLMPALFVALGIVTALSACAAYAEYFAQRELFVRRLLLTGLSVPLNFAVGVWGMDNSRRICAALEAQDVIPRRQRVNMYILMAAVTALSALGAAIILK